MNFTFGAKIITRDNREVGILKEIVVFPATRTVTHLVIQAGLLAQRDTVVPAALVSGSTDTLITLTCNAAELEQCSRAAQAGEFVPLADQPAPVPGAAPVGWAWTRPPGGDPLPQPPPSLIPPGFDRLDMPAAICVPPDDILLDHGTPVESADGKAIGRVSELITDASGKITHLVIREGQLFKTPKLVPIDWINRIEDNQIFLAVNLKPVEDLPEWNSSPT